MKAARQRISSFPVRVERPSTLSPAERAAVLAAIERHREAAGPLMPILHAVQDALRYVPPDAVPLIAEGLNLSRAEVHGVLTFYHWFRATPPGRHVVHVCRAEACQAAGGRDLEAHARAALGIDWHGTSADGAVTLEPVYCLGNCALGPSVMVGEELHGLVTPERFDELMVEVRS